MNVNPSIDEIRARVHGQYPGRRAVQQEAGTAHNGHSTWALPEVDRRVAIAGVLVSLALLVGWFAVGLRVVEMVSSLGLRRDVWIAVGSTLGAIAVLGSANDRRILRWLGAAASTGAPMASSRGTWSEKAVRILVKPLWLVNGWSATIKNQRIRAAVVAGAVGLGFALALLLIGVLLYLAIGLCTLVLLSYFGGKLAR